MSLEQTTHSYAVNYSSISTSYFHQNHQLYSGYRVIGIVQLVTLLSIIYDHLRIQYISTCDFFVVSTEKHMYRCIILPDMYRFIALGFDALRMRRRSLLKLYIVQFRKIFRGDAIKAPLISCLPI